MPNTRHPSAATRAFGRDPRPRVVAPAGERRRWTTRFSSKSSRRSASPFVVFGTTGRSSWGEKHPALVGHEDAVRTTLTDPDEIRRSKRDPNVFLFYRGQRPRWVCAVVRRENGEGFLITAYPTDAIKAGEELWTRSK